MTEPSDPLARAADLLAQTWAQRSVAERSAFVQRLTEPQYEVPSLSGESARVLRERAALSGAVAPRDLVRDIEAEVAARMLDVLAPEFDRTLVDGLWTWTLRSEPRRQTLARLAAAQALPAALADVADIATDAAGQGLRELASARESGSAPPTVDRLPPGTTVQALAWAAPIGGLAGDLAEARRRAKLRALGDSYRGLVSHGVFGRDAELARLRAFAEEEVDPTRAVPLLPIIGIGGAGKSTALASFILPYLDRLSDGDTAAPAVVVIDFDRVLFRVNAELELSYELTRQLGCAAPVAGADFSALRYQSREEQRHVGADVYSGGASHVESATRTSTGFEYEAGLLVRMHGLDARPVVLVLDTFEEWQRERPSPWQSRSPWNNSEGRIIDWIEGLRYQMGLNGLRVVVSGRAEITSTQRVEARPPMLLADLGPPAARSLLQAHGITRSAAGTLAVSVGGNPLTLRVAARFYQRLRPAERKRFLAGTNEPGGDLDGELRRAILYDRFLEHIDDKRVRQLAHPGLVLRRVTADLVQHVLAEHCGLGDVDDQEAADLFEKLADEVWLVKRIGDELRHQPDVRRAMLRMMTGDPQRAEAARLIHQAAARWYDSGRDRLDAPGAEVESLYHTLMLHRGDHHILGGREADPRWKQLALALGEAVTDLPRAVAAQVRVLRGDDLPDEDAPCLPDELWNVWIDQRGKALMDQDEAAPALDLFAARRSRYEPSWLAQAYCKAALWGEYWDRARDLDEPPIVSVRAEPRSGRYGMLNALLSPEQRDLVDWNDNLLIYLNALRAAPPEPILERLFLDLLYKCGVAATHTPARVGEDWRRVSSVPQELLDQSALEKRTLADQFPVDQIRRAVVWIAGSRKAHGPALSQLGGIFRPDTEWLDSFGDFVGHRSRKPFEQFRSRLAVEASTGKLRSIDLLSDWPSQFARVFGDRIELDRRVLRDNAHLAHVLRGDNPELRSAIRLALADVAQDRDGLRLLGSVASNLLPIPVADLQPDALASVNPARARRTLVTLVEYVDCSGVMGRYLTEVRAARPESPLLGRIDDAFEVWEHANRRLLAAIADHLKESR